jgi:MSHA biogenesis protein MshK
MSARTPLLCGLLLALLAGQATAHAAGAVLRDPTRPPALLAAPAEAPKATTPVVESVIITSHVRAAVIDGRWVEVGSRVGDARIVGITEREVTLATGTRMETLRVYPRIGIEPIELGAHGGLPSSQPAAGP